MIKTIVELSQASSCTSLVIIDNIFLTYFAFLQESLAPIPAKKTGTESSRIEQQPHVCA